MLNLWGSWAPVKCRASDHILTRRLFFYRCQPMKLRCANAMRLTSGQSNNATHCQHKRRQVYLKCAHSSVFRGNIERGLYIYIGYTHFGINP